MNSKSGKKPALSNFLCLLVFLPLFSFAQEQNQEEESDSQEASYIHGDFQSDAQYYIYEPKLQSQKLSEKFGNNTYLNLLYDRGNLSGGIRFEVYQPPLLGYDQRFKGSGIPFRFVNYKWKELSVTLGNFYEQIGSGLIYRSYWEFGLGFDNSIDGVRLRYNVLEGITVKAFAGKQRFFFDKGPGIVRGADAELSLNELVPGFELSPTKLNVGLGMVSKFQADDDSRLNLPENVAAFSGRAKVSRNAFNLEAEYAWKSGDPSSANGKIFRPGQALIVTTGYSADGFGISAGVKRIDNFDFRSNRNASLNDLLINYLPPLTPQHTYRLATLYPYATQPTGEMGAQLDLFYNAAEETLLGGK